MQTGLEGKPWNVGLLWGAVAAAILVLLMWWFLVKPVKGQIAAEQSRLQDLQARVQQGRAAQRNLPGLREEVANLELELDKLLRILPAGRDTANLIRRLRLLAEQGDFNLRSFDPQEPVDREFYQEWPIRISLDGNYHNLAMFFDKISRFSRIINVENLDISAQNRGNQSLSAKFTAKTFIYKEPADELPPPGGTP